MPEWSGTAVLLSFAASYVLALALIIVFALEKLKGRSFLPFRVHMALGAVVYLTFVLPLGGWSIYTIIKRDPFWEPFAIIGLWMAAVLLAAPVYVFLWTRHLERQRRAGSRRSDEYASSLSWHRAAPSGPVHCRRP